MADRHRPHGHLTFPVMGPVRASVLMTAWNAERFIGEAIASVLAQTRPPDQVVVNDDGSTDGTRDVLAGFGAAITVLASPHQGTSAGRNRALEVADGDVLAFLDADDLWLPAKLEHQLAALAGDAELDAVFSATDEFIDARGAPRTRPPRAGAVGPLPSALAIRRHAAARVGPFRPDVPVGDWIDWWSRAMQSGVRWRHDPQVLVRRRLHADNNSVRHAGENAVYLDIVRQRLAERRGS